MSLEKVSLRRYSLYLVVSIGVSIQVSLENVSKKLSLFKCLCLGVSIEVFLRSCLSLSVSI